MEKIYDFVDGDVTKFVTAPGLYSIGDELGIDEGGMYRYAVSLESVYY